MISRPRWTSRLYADRSPWAGHRRPARPAPPPAGPTVPASSRPSGRISASRGAAVPSGSPMNSAAARCRAPAPGTRRDTGAVQLARAANSAFAHCRAIICRPAAVRWAIARVSRDSRTRRPPGRRCHAGTSCGRRPGTAWPPAGRTAAAGRPRRSRKTSASLPVFRTPARCQPRPGR